MPAGDLDRLVEVAAVEHVESGDPLLRLGERTVGDEGLSAAHAHERRILDRSKPLADHAGPAASTSATRSPMLSASGWNGSAAGSWPRTSCIASGSPSDRCLARYACTTEQGKAVSTPRPRSLYGFTMFFRGEAVSCGAGGRKRRKTGQCGRTSMTPSPIITTAIIAVEHAPRAGAREHAAQQPSAVGEGEEPGDARHAGARGGRPAAVAVRVGDRSEQEHRVEVDVRVHPGQGKAREHRREERRSRLTGRGGAPVPWMARIGCRRVAGAAVSPSRHRTAPRPSRPSAVARDERFAAGLRPSRREYAVPDEERGAGPADHIDEPRHRLEHRADARDARRR